jgi:predicted dehydrogenase
MNKLRVGVVGAGIGKSHIEAYANLPAFFQVTTICDLDEPRARGVADEFQIPHVVNDIAALYRDDELDVIDICTPSFLHYQQTLDALAGGKHVICEKPIAGSLAEADDLIAAEARSGKRVMPVFQYRFGRGLQKLKFLKEKGVTGRAYLATSETAWRRRPAYYAVPWRGKWKTELGGALVTLSIHAQDAMHFVLGPAASIAAHTATLVNPIETEDSAAISVRMADGSLVSMSVTTGSAVEISRQRFCFENLTAESNLRAYTFTGDDWTFKGDSPEIDEQIARTLNEFETPYEGREAQFYSFACALEKGTAFGVTLADARASLEWITAIYYSAQTREFVTLPIGRDHSMYNGWQKGE